ncbi:phage terminase large subunit family protein [Alishewanella sp. SMS8]|uniref:phage terminase large subunit family protein n=1 Tax=Alishewanella sp. SMS8 TaxID=2994676 RepID=UPI002740AC0D|nr:terminase gpA endonuclease subunit [Alishewanella sp. SMS8]MDP5459880.1 phage terminase large subunit family protein [Alishewanella sp. SMS8]
MMNSGDAQRIKRDIASLLKPPIRMSVTEAVQEHVRVKLPSGNWGPWDIETTPYMREPLDMLSSRKHRGLIFVGPARTGKSQALIDGFIGYDVKCDPSDMLVVQITKEKAAEFSKKRIGPMLENSPGLQPLLSPRGHDNNLHDKVFRAGNYLKIAWPAKSIFASSEWRRVAITDYDRTATMLDVEGEGSGFDLALKRTQSYRSRGMALAESSPGYEVLDPDWLPSPGEPHAFPPTMGIGALYNLGDRRVLYWPCPSCGEFFPANWSQLRWDTSEPDIRKASRTVTCVCPHCGDSEITQLSKHSMMMQSRWVPERCSISAAGIITGTPIDTDFVSYWMQGPAASFQSWEQLVYNYLSAVRDFETTGSQEKLKATVNTDQGRAYSYQKSDRKRNADRLAERAEVSTKRHVPNGVLFLVACVDVQAGKDRRFVVQVHGNSEHERWLIDRYNVRLSARVKDENATEPNERYHQIDPAGYPEDWQQLSKLILDRGYPLDDNSGREMHVHLMVCDHGGEDGVSDNAYGYYRKLRTEGRHHKLMLVKGGSKAQPEMVKISYPDNTKRADRKANAKGDVPLHILATNKLKDNVSNKLERESAGAGYIHFPDWLGNWFYEELTAEGRDNQGNWERANKKRPNEAWDLLCYNEAAQYQLQTHKPKFWLSPPRWAQQWETNTNVYHPDAQNRAPAAKLAAAAPRQRRVRFRS